MKHIITHFACTVPHLLEVKLDKLIYIANLYHYSNHGELLTDIRFFSLSFGPHAPIIRSIISELVESDVIYLMDSRTSTDPVYSNPCKIIKANDDKKNKLPVPWQNTLTRVEEEWGSKSFEDILDYTTRTIPFLSTPYRMQIDWKTIPLFGDLTRILSLDQRAQVHRFVDQPMERPERPGLVDGRVNESDPVSVNEIAEIYLALQGNLPEKIPSQDTLGFDAEDVISAVRTLTGKHEKHLTAIDKAAHLTSFFIDSMSFKSYSGRVAIMTGILLLKRSGYLIDGDILEESWPKGNAFNSVREWFGKVSVKAKDR
jgi:hypothetical protein